MNERYKRWQETLNAPAGLSPVEERMHREAVLDEYAEIKRELFIDGFADYVVKQRFGALTPVKPYGMRQPETWQACGRRLWGKTHFNEAMKRAIERSRAAKTSSRTSPESSSS